MTTQIVTVRQEGTRTVRVSREFEVEVPSSVAQDAKQLQSWIQSAERRSDLIEYWAPEGKAKVKATSTTLVERNRAPVVVHALTFSPDVLADSRRYEDVLADPEDRAWASRHGIRHLDEAYYHPRNCYVRVNYDCRDEAGESVVEGEVSFELTHKEGDLFRRNPAKILENKVLPEIKKELESEGGDDPFSSITLTSVEISNDIDKYDGSFNAEHG